MSIEHSRCFIDERSPLDLARRLLRRGPAAHLSDPARIELAFACSKAHWNVLLRAKRRFYDILLWLK
jgi:hypothetical protein